MSNSTHRVNVVRITGEFTPHPNADTLDLLMVGGYQVVVKRGTYKAGDLVLFVQPDTIVPAIPQFSWLWEGRTLNADGSVPQRLRRITVKNIRKQWSEGLIMPLSEFAIVEGYKDGGIIKYATGTAYVTEGDDVAELLGFTHYEEEEPVQNINSEKRSQYQFPPKTLKGWLYWFLRKLGFTPGWGGGEPVAGPRTKHVIPVYDVEGFKNFSNAFTPEDDVIVTEKVHGSNARYMFDGKTMWAGSKNLWKSEKSTCIWRRALKELPWLEELCKQFPGEVLYGEITPTQKGYNYGCHADVQPVSFFLFDVLQPDGTWEDKKWLIDAGPKERMVPVLYRGPFNAEKIKALADGPSMVPGANHLREGVVISLAEERQAPRGLHRMQLKIKGMKFLEKEGKA